MHSNRPKEGIVTFFDKQAGSRNEKYTIDPVFKYEQKSRQRIILDFLKYAKKRGILLDIGCGTGRDIKLLSKYYSSYTGVDISQRMIQEAKRDHGDLKNVQLLVQNATELEFGDETFDIIICSEVLEHIPNYHKVIKEIYRILKGSGIFIITTPNRRSLYGLDKWIIKLFAKFAYRPKQFHPYDEWKSASELLTVLKRNGLSPVLIRGGGFLPGFLISYKLPVFLKRILVNLISKFDYILTGTLKKYGYTVGILGKKV